MSIFDAFRARRSIKDFTARTVSREQIERLLEAAVLAPNHRMTEPWRFYVLGPAARRAYGAALGARKAKRVEDPAAAVEVSRKVEQKHAGLPAMLAVSVVLAEDPETRAEDLAATYMAIENVLLARSAGELEIALTSVLPADGQPLLVLRARLLDDEAGRLATLLGGQELAVPQRRLGGHQTFALREAAAPASAAPGRQVELAVVGRDLLVANDGSALEELLAPAPVATSAAPRRVLSADARFVGLKKRLAVGPRCP